jgi:hypothetical protein
MKLFCLVLALFIGVNPANAVVVQFKESNTPEQNTQAWNTAVASLKERDLLALPRGEFFHTGLVLENQQHITIGQPVPSQNQSTKLISVNSSAPSLLIRNSQNIEVAGLYLGHATASDQGALVLHNVGIATIDKISTWQHNALTVRTNSQHGLVIWADAGAYGLIRILNSTFSGHAGDGIYIHGKAGTAIIGEVYCYDNVLMDNAGSGLTAVDSVAGLYFSRNSMWNNGVGVNFYSSAPGILHDIFLTENIVDSSRTVNFYAVNVSSGHLKSNWFSWSNSTSLVITGATDGSFSPWEISDNTILSVQDGIIFGLDGARIHNNTVKGNVGTGIALTSTAQNVSVLMNYLKGHAVPIIDSGTNNQALMNPTF